MLQNLCPSTIFPTFFFSPMNHHTFLFKTSLSFWIGFVTFPPSSQMPHSLRQNSVPISNPPSVDQTNSFHFVSLYLYIFSLLDSTTAMQLCCSTVLMSWYYFTLLSHFLIGQLLSLVAIFLLGDSVSLYITWSVHCPCIIYKPPLLYLVSPASSMQFSLVSSFQSSLWNLAWILSLQGTNLLGHCNSIQDSL